MEKYIDPRTASFVCPYCGNNMHKNRVAFLEFGINDPCPKCYEVIVVSEPKPFLEEVEMRQKQDPFSVKELLKEQENGSWRYLYPVWPAQLGGFRQGNQTPEQVISVGNEYVKRRKKYYKKTKNPKTIRIKHNWIFRTDPKLAARELEESISTLAVKSKEYKTIKKEIQLIYSLANNCIEVIFDLEDVLKTLVFTSTPLVLHGKYVGRLFHWTGILDFAIPIQVVYGRVTRFTMSDYNKFGFAQVDIPIPEDLKPEFSLDVSFVRKLYSIINTSHIFYQLHKMYKHFKKKTPTGIEFVDRLNKDKNLKKGMRSIQHLGDFTVHGFFRQYKSSLSNGDVSTICLPLGKQTIFQFHIYSTYSHYLSNSFKPIYALTTALQALTAN